MSDQPVVDGVSAGNIGPTTESDFVEKARGAAPAGGAPAAGGAVALTYVETAYQEITKGTKK